VAVQALRDRAGNVSARLEGLLARQPLSPPDRALARELALGVVRRRGTLEALLGTFLRQPQRRMPGPLREILHVGLYQILYLDRVPDFAAVDEAVRQCDRMHHRRQGGLVNGVLRTVARHLGPREPSGRRFRPDAVPITLDTWRPAGRAVFPDPQQRPADYLAAAFSLPPQLAQRWVARFGGLPAAAVVAAHVNATPPLTLRVNRRRADVQGVIDALAAEGVQAVAHENGASVVAARSGDVRRLKAFRDGLVQPQDAVATAVGLAADPEPGGRTLDFCAAPGTKTTHLAELMDNRGLIVAVDVSDQKLQKVRDNCRRLGAEIVTTQTAEQAAALEPGSFDLALVDAPCSNTGVLARRAEARWRFDAAALGGLVRDQQRLASLAAGFVRPGGRLIYSTCSLEPEENEGVVAWLCGRLGAGLVRQQETLPRGADEPARWYDGGYYAILEVR
jgi:16S rRNA (cytosine967-C5)-methyltransferase